MPTPLTDAHRYALDMFERTHLGHPDMELIDLDAGLAVIEARLVELTGPVIGTLRFVLTPAGHAARKTGILPKVDHR